MKKEAVRQPFHTFRHALNLNHSRSLPTQGFLYRTERENPWNIMHFKTLLEEIPTRGSPCAARVVRRRSKGYDTAVAAIPATAPLAYGISGASLLSMMPYLWAASFT